MKMNKTVLLSLCGILVGMSAWSAPAKEECKTLGPQEHCSATASSNVSLTVSYFKGSQGTTPVLENPWGIFNITADAAELAYGKMTKLTDVKQPFQGGIRYNRNGKGLICSKIAFDDGRTYFQCIVQVKDFETGEIGN